MIDTDSAEFVDAFVSAVRPGEARSRPGWWMAMIAFAAILTVALASLLNGALSGSGSKRVAVLTTWTAVAGPGCTSTGTSFTKSGYYAGATASPANWIAATKSGYTGGGCHGGFVALPLSGHVHAYHSNRYVLWTFSLSAALKKPASCRLFTYIPDRKALSVVGGRPAHYYYGTETAAGSLGQQLGQYVVNQVANRGKWVRNSSFTAVGGQVAVKLVDAGASSRARAAAAQVRLTCVTK